MKLSKNHWDNTEDDETFEPAPRMSRKAIAWGFVLTVAVIYAGLKLWTVLK